MWKMDMIVRNEKQIYQGNLLLVNQRYPYRDDSKKLFVPVNAYFPKILMKHDAANALRSVFGKIMSGDSIVPVSGYRSFNEQMELYNDSLKDNGEDFTKKYVALPNHSEHQTGLAIDLGLNKEEIDFIRPDFPYDGICGTFRRFAPEYGFIERYAKDKEEITGISHEPWHFRYVGYPHSKIIHQQGLSLEEYIDFLKGYRDGNRLDFTQENGKKMEIYYVPAEKEETVIDMPETCVYQISGNNIDGFIVTVWRNGNGKE